MMIFPLEFPPEMLDELAATRILVLVTGTLNDGSAHYAYASIPLEKYLEFKQAELRGAYRLEDYGTVLCHGEGASPPADVMTRMEREHGANHMLEDEMTKLLDTMQANS